MIVGKTIICVIEVLSGEICGAWKETFDDPLEFFTALEFNVRSVCVDDEKTRKYGSGSVEISDADSRAGIS